MTAYSRPLADLNETYGFVRTEWLHSARVSPNLQ